MIAADAHDAVVSGLHEDIWHIRRTKRGAERDQAIKATLERAQTDHAVITEATSVYGKESWFQRLKNKISRLFGRKSAVVSQPPTTPSVTPTVVITPVQQAPTPRP